MEKSEMHSQLLQNSFRMISYGMEYPFGQFKSAVLILFPPSSLGPLLQMALALYIAAAINISVLSSIVFLLEPKRRIVAGALKRTILSQLERRHGGIQIHAVPVFSTQREGEAEWLPRRCPVLAE